jgi:5-methylcytosine-specific restriction endonuclease McrA
MVKRKVSKTKVKKERNPKKVKKVLEKNGYKEGKLPKDKELHHVNPLAKGGKTTPKNTRVISKVKHKKIHKNRRKKGKI